MGTSGFATDLNCMTKIKLGWLKESEYTLIKMDNFEKTVEINPL